MALRDAMARAFARLIALALPAALTAPAHAQASASEIDQVRDSTRFSAGPFYITPAFQLKHLGVDNTADRYDYECRDVATANPSNGGVPRKDRTWTSAPGTL